jgi:putative endopeptidase
MNRGQLRHSLMQSGRAGWVLGVLALLVGGAAQGQADADTAATKAVDRARLDTTCAPCRDFYRYATGAWYDRTTIPPEYSFAGIDREVRDRTEALLHALLDQSAAALGSAPDHDTQLVGALYGSCMDSARVERAGPRPLAGRLAAIDAIDSRATLVRQFARLGREGVPAPILLRSYPDFKNSSQTIGVAFQTGLGLPDRDFYLKPDSTSVRIRRDYRAHVTRVLRLLGESAAAADRDAAQVVALETGLARGALPAVDLSEYDKLYHRMSGDSLARAEPHLGWPAMLREIGLTPAVTINVATPRYYKTLDSLVSVTPVATWRAYLRWHLAHRAAPWLSTPFVAENLRLRGIVEGVTELRPRWKRCADLVDQTIGEALGEVYVRRAFPPEAKARALAMVQDLQATLRDRLQALSWMNDTTRAAALAKLDAIHDKIGYPDRWRDYGSLQLTRDSLLENWFRGNRFEADRHLRKIDRPTDRTEWRMTPPTDNAYYNPSLNEIVFPAGILQPPYFDPNADDAVNYGAAGSVIGHELLHGFDNTGRRFDAEGNLRDWWTPQDSLHYVRRTQAVVTQYSGYIVADTMHLNGRQTLGENLADIAGLQIAWGAYQRAVARTGHAEPIDGFTPEQRFFLSFANAWRTKERPEAERTDAISDVHSLPRFRVNGAVGHLPAFALAFGCTARDSMVRPDSLRLDLW